MPRRKRTKEELEYDLKTETKTCGHCLERKPFSDFYFSKSSIDNKEFVCKECFSNYRKNGLPKREVVKQTRRDAQLKHKYGITHADYLEILAQQNNKCAVCGVENNQGGPYTENFCVDHDHSTKEIRGLLCDHCNRAIGLLKDDPILIKKAIDYLTK